MHKEAERWPFMAVFSVDRPKEHVDRYQRIREEDFGQVSRTVAAVMNWLDIEATATEVNRILREWLRATEFDIAQADIYKMMKPEGMQKREQAGIHANWRYYNNYIDLTLALYGEYLSEPTLTQETELAREVLGSEAIAALMRSVAAKITVHAETTFPEGERDGLVHGAYKSLHPDLSWSRWKDEHPGKTSGQLLPFLYDITMAFKKPLGWTEPPMAAWERVPITKENMRMNVSTPDEDFYWASRARWANVPIWAGPSYTAQLMLLVAQNAGCSRDELQAFAYVIFAYWNQIYPHTATPVHRMFEVMTTAREFQILPFYCEPSTMYLAAHTFISDL